MPIPQKWYRDHKDLIHLFLCALLSVGFLLHWLFKFSLVVSGVIAAPLALALVIALGWFLTRHSGTQNTPIRVEVHPELGQVRIFPDRWEATLTAPPFDGDVVLSGNGSATPPSHAQIDLFRQIRERYTSFLQMAFHALADDFSVMNPPLQSQELRPSRIHLEGGRHSSFSLSFDVPSRPAAIPFGLYADFVDFQVEEAGWIH